jgi:hypothetical protein
MTAPTLISLHTLELSYIHMDSRGRTAAESKYCTAELSVFEGLKKARPRGVPKVPAAPSEQIFSVLGLIHGSSRFPSFFMADVMADPQVPAAPPAVPTLAALIDRQLYLFSKKERASALQNPDATVIADCNAELGVLSNQISVLLPLEPQRLALEQQRLAQLPAQHAHELNLLQLQREERAAAAAAAAANAVQEDLGMTYFAASHFAHEFRPDIRLFLLVSFARSDPIFSGLLCAKFRVGIQAVAIGEGPFAAAHPRGAESSAFYALKMGVIYWASLLQAPGRLLLMLILVVTTRIVCTGLDLSMWSYALAVIQTACAVLKKLLRKRYGKFLGVWPSLALLLFDSCAVFTTWWYILRTSQNTHEIGLARSFIGVGLYGLPAIFIAAVSYCMAVFIATVILFFT